MTRRRQQAQLEAGNRVVFHADPSDRLDGGVVAGEIVKIVGHMAIVRPDKPINGTGVLTTRLLRDLRKEMTE